MTNGIHRSGPLDNKACEVDAHKNSLIIKVQPDLVKARASELLAQVETRGLKHALQEILNEKCVRELRAESEIHEMKLALRHVLEDNDKLLADMMDLVDDIDARKEEVERLQEENKRLKIENLELRKDPDHQKIACRTKSDYEMAIEAMKKELRMIEEEKRKSEERMMQYREDSETARKEANKLIDDMERLKIKLKRCSCACCGDVQKSLDAFSQISLPRSLKDRLPNLEARLARSKSLKDTCSSCFGDKFAAERNLIKPLPLSKHGSERLEALRRIRLSKQLSLRANLENLVHRNGLKDTSSPRNLDMYDKESEKRPSSPTTVIQHESASTASASTKTKLESASITFDQWFTNSASEKSDGKNERLELKKRYCYGYSNSDMVEPSLEASEDESDASSEEALFTIRVNSVHLDDISSCMTDSACSIEKSEV